MERNYIHALSKFLEAFLIDNEEAHVVITKYQVIKPCDRSGHFGIGSRVAAKDIFSIVDMAIRDNISAILRGSGCRFFSFGYDYDAWLCHKHSDTISYESSYIVVSDISDDLIRTDWYDN
ncbi:MULTISPECIES: hypothetical protein [unclassified Sphingomonas]|jgi:hypothetical protein|uniref:hypothetical protein n=1 Tax=unclassified Sphingomonas TaxID=196159 RepID=UPI000AB4646D|nr:MULTISPECIES: hypothetical protein [unclassified Sphingomonas]